jgi:predicted amidophosphoribosyltransferase
MDDHNNSNHLKIKIYNRGFKMTKMCPKCQTINKDSDAFCSNCGSELPKNFSEKGFIKWWNEQTSGSKAAIGKLVFVV